MKPYSVEVFTPQFQLVGNTCIDTVTYKEDYLSIGKNTITVFTMTGIEKQDYIRISGNGEEYAGIITEVSYGTEQSKKLQVITYEPLMSILNINILFDVNAQGVGGMEDYIASQIQAALIENGDALQNVPGLRVQTASQTMDWYLHITPSDTGGHYRIVNLLDSVIIPAMEKYSIMVRARLNVTKKSIVMTIGCSVSGILTIESDLPNIIKKSVILRKTSTDVNKLVLYNATDYETAITYFLHSDLSYDKNDTNRVTPVFCDIRALSPEDGSSFESLAAKEALSVFGNLAYSNLIELTVLKEDALVQPMNLEFGQVADIVSDGVAYRSILTGREIDAHMKLIFGTVRLDLTKLLRRDSNGQ